MAPKSGHRTQLNGEWRAALALRRINQQGQAGHMVEMRMGEEDMVDPEQSVEVKAGQAGAGIEQNIVVDQQAGGQPFASANAAGAA
jgi:hypothetical protein